MKCRHCANELKCDFLNLDYAPPSNAYLLPDRLAQSEMWLPLRIQVCEECWLVQTLDFTGREVLFDENYAYFSSFSSSWLAHAKNFVETAINRLGLDSRSKVVEVASNDGYLLQYVASAGIPCFGVEPTHSTAQAAREKGITVFEEFFGAAYAHELKSTEGPVDLLIANNVLAHVPDINDFVTGVATLLKDDGVASFEFPHLLNMVRENQFDTAYHEHFSYLSLAAVRRIFQHNGLRVYDVERLSTHGGSLRVWAQRSDVYQRPCSDEYLAIAEQEAEAGIETQVFYTQAQERALQVKYQLLKFLLDARTAGKKVIAYGAAAKGNTLFNFSGVKSDLVDAVIDLNPNKQNKFMPGSHIPIRGLSYLLENKPDYVLVLPWNLFDEVRTQLRGQMHHEFKFVRAIPELQISD